VDESISVVPLAYHKHHRLPLHQAMSIFPILCRCLFGSRTFGNAGVTNAQNTRYCRDTSARKETSKSHSLPPEGGVLLSILSCFLATSGVHRQTIYLSRQQLRLQLRFLQDDDAICLLRHCDGNGTSAFLARMLLLLWSYTRRSSDFSGCSRCASGRRVGCIIKVAKRLCLCDPQDKARCSSGYSQPCL